MRKISLLKNVVLSTLATGLLGLSCLFCAPNFLKRSNHIYNVNYLDSEYDETFILSPITTESLTSGSYYILVTESNQLVEDITTGIYNQTTKATAFCTNIANTDTKAFTFEFTDEQEKTIDVRKMGAQAGGSVFQYLSVTVDATTHTTTYNSLVSMSNYSFVRGEVKNQYVSTSGITTIEDSTSWTITASDDAYGVRQFSFYNEADEAYIHSNGTMMVYSDATGTFVYEEEDGTTVEVFNSKNFYVYEVSQSLAEQLSFGACAQAMANAETNTLRSLYCALPYYERRKFYDFSKRMDTGITTDTQIEDIFHTNGDNIVAGINAYLDAYPDEYHGADIDPDALIIDYSAGYINGFSPFECGVTLTCYNETTGGNMTSYMETVSSDRGDEAHVCTENYVDQRLYFIDNRGNNLYGQTITLYAGNQVDYPELCSTNPLELEIEANTGLGFDGTLKVADATKLDGTTIQAIFDGEVQLEQIGEYGEYEYALSNTYAYERWGSYYLQANPEKLHWSKDPKLKVFTNLGDVTANIDEETQLVAYVRKAATRTAPCSPVLAVLTDIIPANFDDGYIERIDTMNYSLYTENKETLKTEVYDVLESDRNFEMFNLEDVRDDVASQLSSLTAKADATGILTPEGLEMTYQIKTHIHQQVALNLMDSFSNNQTTRSYNYHMNLIEFLVSYEINFDSTAESQIQLIDETISTYLTNIEVGLSIDNICKDYIRYFNDLVKQNPGFSGPLWESFDYYFWLIHDATTVEEAQQAYNWAKDAFTSIIVGSGGSDISS